jgi:hypothetical protein
MSLPVNVHHTVVELTQIFCDKKSKMSIRLMKKNAKETEALDAVLATDGTD